MRSFLIGEVRSITALMLGWYCRVQRIRIIKKDNLGPSLPNSVRSFERNVSAVGLELQVRRSLAYLSDFDFCMSICLFFSRQSHLFLRCDCCVGTIPLGQASKFSKLSSRSLKPCTVFSRSHNVTAVRRVSVQVNKNGPKPASGDTLLSAHTSLKKSTVEISAKRIKWGLVDPELRQTVDTLHQSLSREPIEREHGPPQSHDLFGGPGDYLAKLDGIPLSPLMEPNAQQAKKRHREPKLSRSSEETDFQIQLAKNPYGIFRMSSEAFNVLIPTLARMLASPVRLCTLTHARLPLDFLSAFSPIEDPRTGHPWLNPGETSIKYLGKRDPNTLQNESINPVSGGAAQVSDPSVNDAEKSDCPTNGSSIQASSFAGISQPQHARSTLSRPIIGSSVSAPLSLYVVSSTRALDKISSLGSRQNHRFVPSIWKDNHGIQSRDIIWRKDMSNYILDQMRYEALKGLRYLASRPGSMYLVPVQEAWSAADKITQVGAFLWTGMRRAAALNENSEDSSALRTLIPPPPYAMLNWRKHQISVYNLPHLLGEAGFRCLMENKPVFGNELIAVKRKSNTAGLQMVLWKIMGYLAVQL